MIRNLTPSVYKIDEEAAKKWLAAGAQPTEVVAKLLKLPESRNIPGRSDLRDP